MADKENAKETGKPEAKTSPLEWINALMPFLTSNNFLVIVACLLSLAGGSFLGSRDMFCKITQGIVCQAAEPPVSVKSLLTSDIQKQYGLYPIKKPGDESVFDAAEIKQAQRNLSAAIADLCTGDEINNSNGKTLQECIDREVLIQELREMAGLAEKDVEASVFNTLPEVIYVSTYAADIDKSSSRNSDYITPYVAHVCNKSRGETTEPGKFRYRLLQLYSDRSKTWGTSIRGIPSLPCGDNPQDIPEFSSVPLEVTEIIRIHPVVYEELFGKAPSPVKTTVRIKIEPIGN